MVFQNYALYPHMTVYENMAFGLKLAKRRKERKLRRPRMRSAPRVDLEAFAGTPNAARETRALPRTRL